jgi:dolichol-phosphate mannosyltransferase
VTTEPRIDVSIVIPLRNEEESILSLFREISDAMAGCGFSWECLWIDDGSTDGSLSLLKKLSADHQNQQYVELDGHYGQAAALIAGFQAAGGEIICTLDADLQNNPRDILRIVAALRDNDVHMVNGYREKRHDSFVRKVSSTIANGFRRTITRSTTRDVGCSMRGFYKEAVRGIPSFRGMHRFLPTLVELKGYKTMEIPVDHRPRRYGRTKYGIGNRLWVGIADTLAVRWMQKRLVYPRTRSTSLQTKGRD